ncbi:butyrophilin subfamily 1 member A1-like isoform X1 [Lates japonicus]|uniref:Butyrophilin subfamily 1 member A1-like isoform X1 n=1 Tax=Lates japonicus TaxID=270547 RepID=A0AAD3RGJ0_LATJO|nr:butyrophilin subfamily 1 member A1-like isoform X1 [Lates japonicus]
MERESRFITFRGLVLQTVTILVALHSSTGSVSSPVITRQLHPGAVVLECESKGWYPEPECCQLDGEETSSLLDLRDSQRSDSLYTITAGSDCGEETQQQLPVSPTEQNQQTTETEIHVQRPNNPGTRNEEKQKLKFD